MGESAAAKAVQKVTGMWWPDADPDKLRTVADAWEAMATAIDNVTAPTNQAAAAIVANNHGPAIDAFGKFWARYYGGKDSAGKGKGWLPETADACRALAKALRDFAHEVDKAIKKLEEEAAIVGGTLVVGAALAIVTFSISADIAAATAAGIVATAAAVGVTVSEAIATIAATVLVSAAFGAVEAITVDLAVAQPIRVELFGDGGYSLTEAADSAKTGGIMGGAGGGLGAGARVVTTAAETTENASVALASLAKVANAADTVPGRMITGAGLTYGYDTAFKTGPVMPLDLVLGAVGSAAGPRARSTESAPYVPRHAKPVELPMPGKPPLEYVEDHPTIAKVKTELARVPPEIFNKVWDHLKEVPGGGVSIGPRPVTQLPGGYHLGGVRPVGGTSPADNVPGMYIPGQRRLLVNSAAETPSSVAVHEFGHAVDDAYGNLSRQPEWQHVQQQVMDRIGNNPRLTPYIRQPHEYFAEAFNQWTAKTLEKFTFGNREAAQLLEEYFERAFRTL
ncbi:WXG100-like domain-containing protein [Kitasatospora aureofaciens]|uniref:WXG100-like domain-containing protein n=1 Tax=Kitasatospora aureofaciens TaxID=1894 RepID=UPI0036F455B8